MTILYLDWWEWCLLFAAIVGGLVHWHRTNQALKAEVDKDRRKIVYK